jgi:uncharacterized repeat protein (TIGR03803 family)
LSVFVTLVFLAGCSAAQLPIGAPGAAPEGSALAVHPDSTYNYKVVYSFGAAPDGISPQAGLIDVRGKLYGTTSEGGSNSCGSNYEGCGTVFSVTPGGTEKVLHSFGAESDGRIPEAGLVDVGGTLYGTTVAGGSYACYGTSYFACGTVFSITLRGTENVLYNFGKKTGFGDPTNGAEPYAGLIDVKGTLYGTTEFGGPCSVYYYYECGTVFSISTTGTVSLLHGFMGHPSDGAHPVSGLVDVKGTLYGTTSGGGKHRYGTVFSVTTGGTEKVLHSFGRFGSGSHACAPHAGLVDVGGTFYGTTVYCGTYNKGTVFSVAPSGATKVLHSFGALGDGVSPDASLIELNGKLYGTTAGGGAYSCGCGTVFRITASGSEKILHSFGAHPDGAGPYAGLVDVKGTLYGTTGSGGAYGNGTVFSLKP